MKIPPVKRSSLGSGFCSPCLVNLFTCTLFAWTDRLILFLNQSCIFVVETVSVGAHCVKIVVTWGDENRPQMHRLSEIIDYQNYAGGI